MEVNCSCSLLEPGNVTKRYSTRSGLNSRTAVLLPPSKFPQLRNSTSRATRHALFAKIFPNSLNEIGRESGNIAHASAAHRRTILYDAKNLFTERRLGRLARSLCCA